MIDPIEKARLAWRDADKGMKHRMYREYVRVVAEQMKNEKRLMAREYWHPTPGQLDYIQIIGFERFILLWEGYLHDLSQAKMELTA